VFWRGWSGYEPETIPLFYRLAQRAQTTIDVGAYVGFYTLIAAHANASGRVYAFEPMSDVFERLRSNVSLNRLENVMCINSAVGDDDGEAEFFHMSSEMPCSSSLSYQFMSSVVDLKVSKVSVTTLDRFVLDNKIERVDLVKIDTETTEPQVIRGMSGILARDNPDIVCEVLGRGSESALEEMLRPLGYHFYHLTPDGPVLRTQITGHPEWLNYLFSARCLADIQQS
jgi:FkbM family methyltransferase